MVNHAFFTMLSSDDELFKESEPSNYKTKSFKLIPQSEIAS